MKVLQVLPELNAGGVERTTLEIAEALRAKGYEPHVCSNGGRLLPNLVSYGAVHHQINIGSKNPLKLRANTKALVEIIKAHNIDIVHARSRAPAWPAYAAAKATKRHFVTTYHGIYNAKNRAKRRYNAIMARGERVIANSNYTKSHILETHGTSKDIIRVIPRGVDMRIFDPDLISGPEIADWRSNWGAQPSDKVVMLPGRLTRWKGQIVAIRALALLPDNYKLVCLGDAQGREKYVSEMRELAQSMGVAERVMMPGHSLDIQTALMAADIIIAPSLEPEAFGRVVAEAQAMRRPVIASAHGGPMETVIPGKTGLLTSPGDFAALAEAIKNIEAFESFDGAKARAHISANYSKSQLQDKTLAVYAELM